MLNLILLAISLGFILSLVLIGPVFFLLLETSLTKGTRAAIALDTGVILGDVLCIITAYFFSNQLYNYIQSYPFLFQIGGLIIGIYGLFLVLKKEKLHYSTKLKVEKGYFPLISKGFFLNVVNLGVWFFWLIVVLACFKNYESKFDIFLFLSIVIATFIGIDLAKIILAKRFKNQLSDQRIRQIKKGIGMVLIIFGISVFYKSFQKVENIEQQKLYQELTH